MRTTVFILLTLFVWNATLYSQNLCSTCPCLLEQGNLKATQGKNTEAISLYQAYVVCDPTKAAEVTERISKIQKKTESEKQSAVNSEVRAKNSELEAKKQKDRADEEARRSRRQSRSNHNLAVTLRTLQQDPTMAIRMAEYSINGQFDNSILQQVYADISSNSENYFYRRHEFIGHSGEITGMALSSGSQQIVTASTDKTVRIWDDNGVLRKTIRNLPGVASLVQFSPDSRKILVADSTWFAVIDTSGQLLFKVVLSPENYGSAVTFSLDGNQWAHGDHSGCIRRWDSSGLLIDSIKTNAGKINRIYFSPHDKSILACGASGQSVIWNVCDTGNKFAYLNGHKGGVKSGAFSLSGDSVLTVGFSDNTARMWNLKGDSLGAFSDKNSTLARAAFIKKDSILLEFRDNPPALKDLKKQDFLPFAGGKAYGYDVKLRGNYILLILKPKSADNNNNKSLIVRIYTKGGNYRGRFTLPARFDWPDLVDVSTSQEFILYFKNKNTFESYRFSKQRPAIFAPPASYKNARDKTTVGSVTCATFSPDSKLFIYHLPNDSAATIQRVTDIPPKSAQPLLRPLKKQTAVLSIDVNPKPGLNGRYYLLMLNSDSTASLLDTTARERWTTANLGSPVIQAQFAADGQHIFTTHADSTFWLWKPESNLHQRIGKYTGTPYGASLSPDGTLIAAGGSDHRVHTWSVIEQREKVVFPEFDTDVKEVIFLPDSRQFVVRTAKGEVSLWHVDQPEKPLKVWRSFRRDQAKTTARAWEMVVLSSKGDQVLLIDDENTPYLSDLLGKNITELNGHQGPITSATFSEDGNYILTASRDSTVRLWNRFGNTMTVYTGEFVNGIEKVAISPDNRRALVVDGAGSAFLWKTPTEWLKSGVEHFTANDLAINDLLPDPDQIDSITHAAALEQAASNFLKQHDVETAHKLYIYLLHRFPDQGENVWYNWYITGMRRESDWDTLLAQARPLYPIAEDFKKDKYFGEAKKLYEYLIDEENRTGLLWDYIEVCRQDPRLRVNKSLFFKEQDAGKTAYYARHFQSEGDITTARSLFRSSLQKQTTAQSIIGLMVINRPEDQQLVNEKIAALTDADELLGIANFLWEKKRDRHAADLYHRVMSIAEKPEAGIGLYEISRINPNTGFDAHQMAQSNSRETLQSYADYFGGKGDVALKIMMLQRLIFIGKADAHDHFERYLLLSNQGNDVFSELLELQEPRVLKGLMSNFAIQGGIETPAKGIPFYVKAVQLGERLIDREDTAKNRNEVSQNYNSLGWNYIATGAFEKAEKAIRQGIKIYNENPLLYSNLPHTLLFQGKIDDALKIYEEYQSKTYQPERNRPYYLDVYLADFKGFRKDFAENPHTPFSQKMMTDMDSAEKRMKENKAKKSKAK